MKKNTLFALCMAILWGLVFGLSLHSWTLGICLGLCFGIAFGLFDSKDGTDRKEGNENDL